MPFLDAIVQTEEGIIQLIAVERIRETALGGYILDQGAALEPSSLESRHSDARHGRIQEPTIENPGSEW